MTDRATSRRTYLLLAGSAASGLAGCIGGTDDSGDETDGTNNGADDKGGNGDGEESENGDGGGEADDEDGEENGDGRGESDVDALEHDGLIGAHYYPWYGEGQEWVHETPVTPELGEYASRDPEVIDQHIAWAAEHGVNWFSVSWWGPDGYEDETLRNHLLESPIADELRYSILFESPGLLPSEDGITYDFDDGETVDALVEAMSSLAESYFDRDEYLRIDGRPVVTFYLARDYAGDFEAAMDAVADEIGEEPYVIGDLVYWMSPDSASLPDFGPFDAATSYNMHTNEEDIDVDFVERVLEHYDEWAATLDEAGVAFVPGTIPGFDDTHVEHVDRPDHPVIEASPDRFESFCDGVNAHASPEPDAVLITSWNEWYENTQIEPHEEHGTEYLEVVAETLVPERGG